VAALDLDGSGTDGALLHERATSSSCRTSAVALSPAREGGGRGEGEVIWMFDSLDTIKAEAKRTGGGFTVVEFLDFEGSSVPLHANDRWDADFYNLDGEYRFVVADETVAASPCTWVYVPRRPRTRGGAVRPGGASSNSSGPSLPRRRRRAARG
jgi:hypothetical protein